ncbi:hypothetical protein [Rhodococcus sp. NPDC058514]
MPTVFIKRRIAGSTPHEVFEQNLRYGFRQLEGDLVSFQGYWQVSARVS